MSNFETMANADILEKKDAMVKKRWGNAALSAFLPAAALLFSEALSIGSGIGFILGGILYVLLITRMVRFEKAIKACESELKARGINESDDAASSAMVASS